MTTCLELEGTLKINSKEDDEAAKEAKRFEEYFEGLTEEEKSRAFQESRIHVFELLTKRFGLGVLELREDTLHPLGLKLE